MASKGGKGKEKQVKSPPQVEPEKPPEREIVPGKITESQWAELLSIEEGVEIVSELVEEVCEVSFSIVYSHYLEEQAFPHSVDDAKHSLLKIIEWQFLSRDEGEQDTACDPSWIEDEEPLPSSIDSWARGIVPQHSTSALQSQILTSEPVVIQPCMVSTFQAQEEQEREETTDFSSERQLQSAKSIQSRTNASTISSSSSKKTRSPIDHRSPAHRQPRRARPKVRRPEARLVALEHPPKIDEGDVEEDASQQREAPPSSAGTHTPTSFISDDHALSCHRPMPYGMKPSQLNWQKEVTYDERGNIIDMIKLDPATFPSRKSRPIVRVLPESSNKQHRIHHHRTKADTSLKQTYTKSSPAPLTLRKTTDEFKLNTKQRHKGQRSRVVGSKVTPTITRPSVDGLITTKESLRFPEMPALPPLVDTINPVPGVTVREGSRTIRGPKVHQSLQPPTSPKRGMRLVKPLDSAAHSYSEDGSGLRVKQPRLTQVS